MSYYGINCLLISRKKKMDKIKNLLYKMHKNDEIWLDEDRMWHRKES